jgi:aldehyde dehydrogenase (NAD+)
VSILLWAKMVANILPPGVVNIVNGFGIEAGKPLAQNKRIAKVAFTGETTTGRLIMQYASENIIPVTLELGGKSPQIVFADADLELALPAIVNAIVQNAGQTCSAGSRLLVEAPIYEAVLTALGQRFDALRAGPALADLDCGPLIRASQLQRVRGFLTDAQRDGIAVAGQGAIVADAPSGGFYAPPTLLRDVPATHRLARDEVFGPLLAAMSFADEAHAIRLANATDYGLVAGVWTRDGGRQMRMARAVQSGQVFINSYGAGGGVELPFGGV